MGRQVPALVHFAFSTAADGDVRADFRAQHRLATEIGAPYPWAWVDQVHGNAAVEVTGPGLAGSADALFTSHAGVGLAIYVADCAAVVLLADHGVGIAHVGWRGAAAGVVSILAATMSTAGCEPHGARVSPFIGPCCFEVGPEVAKLFPDAVKVSRAGRTSVDLGAAIASQLSVEVEMAGSCTYHDEENLSHRRLSPVLGPDRVGRMAAVAWLGES